METMDSVDRKKGSSCVRPQRVEPRVRGRGSSELTPLTSWLADDNVQQKHAAAYAVFGGTRAAYREVDS